MYAVLESGGKQFRVKEGDIIEVERLRIEPGQEVVFDRVLLLNSEKGLKIGTPYLEDVKVRGVVLDEAKGEKVMVYRPPSKKAVKKLRGHRQWYTKVRIKEIVGG